MSRPKLGKQKKECTGVRIEPRDRARIKKLWGGVQKFLDAMILIHVRQANNPGPAYKGDNYEVK